MTDKARHCLDTRIDEIEAMLGEEALFQAGATIAGSRRCASLKSCDRWADCSAAHDHLWGRLSSLIQD